MEKHKTKLLPHTTCSYKLQTDFKSFFRRKHRENVFMTTLK